MMLAEGLADQALDSQRAFRAAMDALARPGRILACGDGVPADAPLPRAAAALVLGLCDYETTLHLSPSLAGAAGVADYLRFHTGARLVASPGAAAFALVDLARDGLRLDAFAQGIPDYPDRSTTVIALANSVSTGGRLSIAGPGVASVAELAVTGLPADFTAQWAANRAAFPLGVDILFADAHSLVGLPRSARIIAEGR